MRDRQRSYGSNRRRDSGQRSQDRFGGAFRHDRHDRGGSSGPVRRDLVRLIGLLVDDPDEIEVREGRGGHRNGAAETFFKVWVAPEDLGKVIGRQGRTARALRTLLEVRGAHDGRRYGLEIREA